MFIKYTYKAITNVNQVQLIVADIKALVTADTTTSLTTDDKQAQLVTVLQASPIANSSANAPVPMTTYGGGLGTGDCIVCCSTDPTWIDITVPPVPPATPIVNIGSITITAGAGTYKKKVTIANGRVNNLQSSNPNPVPDSYVLSSLYITASYTPIINGVTGAEIPAPGAPIQPNPGAVAPSVGFLTPKIYQNGGTLYIAATNNYLFISSVDNSKKQFTPGLGVVDFVPYAISPVMNVAATDTYYATGDYPTWVYFSMNGYNNISTCLRYNINTKLNQTNKMLPDLVESNYLQVKSPYVSDIAKVSIGMPAITLNANLNKALLCARLEIHNKFSIDHEQVNDSTSLYDIGGDVSMIAPIFLTANGRALDMLDVLMPIHDELPDMDTLSAEDVLLYKSYYGTFMIWSSRMGALGSPGVKYAVRMG